MPRRSRRLGIHTRRTEPHSYATVMSFAALIALLSGGSMRFVLAMLVPFSMPAFPLRDLERSRLLPVWATLDRRTRLPEQGPKPTPGVFGIGLAVVNTHRSR